MKLGNFIKKLDGETQITIKHELLELDKTSVWYRGLAKTLPYEYMDYEIFYEDAIRLDDQGGIEIILGKPNIPKKFLTNIEYLDSLDEEEKLIMIIALLYNYDSGTIYYESENFDLDNEWGEVMTKVITFFEKRYGQIANRKAYLDWIYKTSANRREEKGK